MTAKNLQKACCVCRVVILSIQPIAFLKFSLLSPSCHLKLTMLTSDLYFVHRERLSLFLIEWFQKIIIHDPTKEGYWKFHRGGGAIKAKFFKGKYEVKLEFPEGRGVSKQNPSLVVSWIFSGTTHYLVQVQCCVYKQPIPIGSKVGQHCPSNKSLSHG